MTTPNEPQKNPTELLADQAQSLKSILAIQQNIANIHKADNDFLANWLKVMLEEQRKQSKYLSNLSTAATLFTILVVIGFLIGFCSAIM